MQALIIIFLIVLAYLLGSIPTAVWIGKMFYGVDIRKEGSGNAGATNTFRVLGWRAGVPVLVIDIFKGWLAVFIINWIPENEFQQQYMDYYRISLAIAAVTGHIFPVFARFKGGKGVATLLGIGLGIYGTLVLYPVGMFLLVLLFSEYVSLASIVATLLFPLDVYYFGDVSQPLLTLSFLVAIFVPLAHWKNIKRLLKGKESKASFRKKK